MLKIQKYLEKFSKNISLAELDKKKIIEILKKQTGLDFSPESVEIKDCIIYIKSSPAVKNKIFICKKNIFDEIVVFGIKIVDIR